MNGPAEVGIATYELFSGGRVRRCLGRVEAELETLAARSDEEIVAACQEFVTAPKLPGEDVKPGTLRSFVGADLGERDSAALALAAEAFSRFPPQGLPRGARLYGQQLLAAIHLMRGALVQMDTGEGKTFALSAAALALLRVHPKVYIVTANPYLAARDAVNTAPIWDALGVSVGMAVRGGLEGSDPWRARVVYTTLEDLAFRSLSEDLGEVERLLKWSAVLIDEADAVLLEKSVMAYQLLRTTDDLTKDWSEPLRIARGLSADDLKVGTSLGLSAKLTAEGEARVATLAGIEERRPVDRLLLLREVELAYIAIAVAREGHDYEVRDGGIVTIDPNTGWHTPSLRYSWVAPLETHHGLRNRPHRVIRHFVDGIAVLRRFTHLAGTSGTIINEALDYALLLALPPALVAPRRPRLKGALPDVVTGSRQRAHEWVEEEVARQGARRPILIATESTVEAQQVAERLLASERIEGVRVRPVTDETIAAERVFESAGQPGVTIVSTRVAGRGVDIRLSPQAREAGGALLLSIGHSLEARLDRQLLGRVGREGEPYNSRFINHPEDPLISRIAPRRIETILNRGTEDGMLDSGPFPRLLASVQRNIRRERLQRFALGVGEGLARGETVGMLREWRQALGTRGEDLPEGFASFLADRFAASHYPALSFGSQSSIAAMSAVADGVVGVAGGGRAEAMELTGKAAGRPLEEAREVFTTYLEGALVEAQDANESARADFRVQRQAAERAAVKARLAGLSDGFDGGSGPTSAVAALELALAVAPDAGSVPVGTAIIDSTLDGFARELDAAGEESDPVAALQARAEAPQSWQADLAAFDPRWSMWAGRSSWSIASETIDRATQQLESGLERVRFRVGQTASGPRFASAYRAEVEDLRREVEATLAADACANLFTGARPALLDELFSASEHQVQIDEPRVPLALPTLAPPANPVLPAPDLSVSSSSDALIIEYAEAAREQLGGEVADEEALVIALKMVMSASELTTLVNPDRVAQAYVVWKRSDMRKAEIPPWRWRPADRYVKGFFAFLHDRGLAAPLPSGLPQRSRSLARRAWKRVASPGLALAAAGLVGAAVMTIVLGFAPPVSGGYSLGVGPELMDRLLSAGAFSSGSALGPVLLALMGGLWARLLFGLATTSDAGIAPIEREAATLLLVLGAVVAARPWSNGLDPQIVVGLGVAVLLIVSGFVVRNSVYRFEQMTHYHLLALLAAGFAAFSALPLLISLDGSTPVAILAGIAIVALLASRPLRRARIGVLALHVEDNAGQTDSMEVSLPVIGRLSVVPHAFALAFAWTLSCVVLEAGAEARSIVAGVTYLAVLAFWAHVLAGSVTEAEDWRQRMRGQQQAFEPARPGMTLADALAAARRRVFLGEVATVAPLVALATVLAAGAPVDLLSQLPLGVATVCVAVIVVDLGMVFVRGLRAPLPGTTEVSSDSFGDEFDGTAAKIRGAVYRYTKWMSVAIAVILGVVKLLEFASLGEFVVHLFNSAKGLF